MFHPAPRPARHATRVPQTQPSRRAALAFTLAAPAILFGATARAQSLAVFARHGLAIGGADPVAYFDVGDHEPGDPAHSRDWAGVTWLFSTADRMARFTADPEALAPRYGGYCAWAVARDYLADTIPEAWSIHEGRLYLNANLRIRRRWLRDPDAEIAAADANWPGVLG